jgi:anti-anti-sigma regulatory factor
MWRIERQIDRQLIVLKISGRMQGEQLAELEEAFALEAGIRKVAVDLKDVRLIDQDTVKFLAAHEAGGIRLLNCPPYIREWISSVSLSNGNT